MILIRQLTRDDAAVFRDIRLEGLKGHPEAFASSYAEEKGKSLERFADQIETGRVFGGFEGDVLMGVAGVFVHAHTNMAHKGVLWGMYVRPSARRVGLGQRLVEAVLEYASSQVGAIQLSVIAANESARRLYERCGFECYGVEPKAIKLEGRYYDHILMQRDLP